MSSRAPGLPLLGTFFQNTKCKFPRTYERWCLMSVCPPPHTLFSFCRCVTFFYWLRVLLSTLLPLCFAFIEGLIFFSRTRVVAGTSAGIVSYLFPSYSCQVSNQTKTHTKETLDGPLRTVLGPKKEKADIIVLTKRNDESKQDSKVDNRSLL